MHSCQGEKDRRLEIRKSIALITVSFLQISDDITAAIQEAGAVLLQREIPEVVNVIFAKLARSARVPIILDAGGADKPLGHDLLTNVSILSPNETGEW